jgi:GNAT superfamily N-acetyltransferase
MGSDVVLRAAVADDVPALLGLYRQLNPGDPVLPEDAALVFWHRMASQDGVSVLVAEHAGVVSATCTLVVVANLTHGGQPYALVENVVTDSAHRGRGLGRAVLDEAVARAWAAGCYKVMLMTGSRLEATLRFYENAGFTRGKTAFQIRRE